MKSFFVILLVTASLGSGCASDGLEDLHLVSTEEISRKKFQPVPEGDRKLPAAASLVSE